MRLVRLYLAVITLRDDDVDIARLVHHGLALVDHVSEYQVGGFVVLHLCLQFLASLHQGFNMGQLLLHALLLEPLLLAMVQDLLSGAATLAAHLEKVRSDALGCCMYEKNGEDDVDEEMASLMLWNLLLTALLLVKAAYTSGSMTARP